MPIHTAPDDPDGGAYGVWCAGQGFRAEFRPGGLRFLPSVGSGADGAAWTWTAVAITAAGVPLLVAGDRADTAFDADRFETRRSAVTEWYRRLPDWDASGTFVTYDQVSPPSTYGSSCSPATPSWLGFARRGAEFTSLRLTGAPPNVPAVVVLATHTDARDLSLLGMWGCFLLIDEARSTLGVPLVTTTDASGVANFPLPLVESWVSRSLFAQWLLVEPGANRLGVTTTRGLFVTVAW